MELQIPSLDTLSRIPKKKNSFGLKIPESYALWVVEADV